MTQHPHPSPIVSTEDVEGTAVYDVAGNKIGRVDHLMVDKASGRVTAAVINVVGLFGIGHSHREVPWTALAYSTRLHGYLLLSEPVRA
jgi:sporulation protein YlmC with PRC-barrel domain